MMVRASVLFAPLLLFLVFVYLRPNIAVDERRGTRRIDGQGDYCRVLHEQLPTCVPACVCVCVLCVGSVTNDLYPPPLAVADFGLRRTGVLYKQTSKQETASRVEGTGQSGVGYALGGGGAEAKGMGDDQMDAGISEHRFIIVPLEWR